MSDDDRERPDPPAPPPGPASPADSPGPRSEAASPTGRRPTRPSLSVERTPVTREHAGYTFRLDPPDLANLRELPGARGKSDDELGAEFLAAQADRLASALAEDVSAPAVIRVLVDPYSRQAFLAWQDRVRGIVSF
jgi:hypothetical protein